MARQAAQQAAQQGDRATAWLSLGPASRIVGVDPDTLRRWANSGKVRSFATPGGHRRFSRAELDRLTLVRRPSAPSLAALGATSEHVTRAYARAYRDRAPIALDRLGPDAREAFRADGRRLVSVLLAYLDATRPPDRERWESEALSLIGSAAIRLAEAGADVEEVISIYLRARQPLLGELAAVGKRRALDATQLAGLYDRAIGLLDRLLLHLVATHSAASAGHRTR